MRYYKRKLTRDTYTTAIKKIFEDGKPHNVYELSMRLLSSGVLDHHRMVRIGAAELRRQGRSDDDDLESMKRRGAKATVIRTIGHLRHQHNMNIQGIGDMQFQIDQDAPTGYVKPLKQKTGNRKHEKASSAVRGTHLPCCISRRNRKLRKK